MTMMFGEEEKRLSNYKKNIDRIDIPEDKLENAMFEGIRQAKKKKRSSKWKIPALAAAVFLISFILTVRVSPVMAGHIASIPGMDRIVELIRYDRGLQSAVNNEYMEPIGASRSIDGVKVTIDSAIYDEYGLVLFYTIELDEPSEYFYAGPTKILDETGDQITAASSGPGLDASNDNKTFTGLWNLLFEEKTDLTDLTVEFEIDDETLSIPFSLTGDPLETKQFDLNQVVEVEGQKVEIQHVKISPIRAIVELESLKNNSMKLLSFENMKMVNGNGDEWGIVTNGASASGESYYLQSNYFEMPEELSLVLGKIQAIDKDEASLVIDTFQKKVLKKPDYFPFEITDIERGRIEYELKGQEFPYSLFGQITDADEKTFYESSSGMGGFNGEKTTYYSSFETTKYQNPISLEFSFYPQWIESDEKIKIFD
ncbi:DUF4179 domain-containing protein [Jeotgalibacillus sp. R-1-5s-1]|uniref:DUF4179 domain-containing protein n=1 Tax=Jeotgalibacillus sp. R-1-5s-1 TaxID=2555897 RepID=UPI00106BA75C|nr:DUF4179 domain-containing protein [Jeotgalibacillus sp. R-1-5s-1]TFE01358.1 DUF4179 domain-containing protein [Jeotgalibacillus sp. R-1-5s-1]